jgi:DNA repair exonuclease SbcCD nuclease subunit
MAFRFVHTGDLHLDSPFVGLTSEAPPGVVQTLREATIRAWDNVVDLALAEQVDFFLVAGDAFEHANRTLRGQLAFRDGLARLADAHISSFVVTGNHDPLDGWEPSVAWPELAHRFPAHDVTARQVLRDGEEIARVYGVSYHRRDVTTNLARRYRREADAPFAVGLLHANVGGLEGAANYAPCSIGDLQASGMDYWALGHIHRHHVVSAQRPAAVYCGNPQGRDPGEADPRGCYLVTVDDAGRITPEFRPVDVVRWQLLDVLIGDLETEEELVDAVTTAVDEARAAAERSIVARVRLTGRGPLHTSLAKPGLREDVRTGAQDRLGLSDPFGWIESVRDRTRPAVDLETRRQADDFVGDLLRRLDATRRVLAGDEPLDGGTVDGVPIAADVERVVDDLYANQRARRPLQGARPEPARLASILDEVEAILVDRLGGEA